jgi:SPOR domain
MVVFCSASCGSPADGTSGGEGATVPSTTVTATVSDLPSQGSVCRFGTMIVPSLALGLGPVAIRVDSNGKVSFAVSGQIAAFGPLTLNASLGISGERPSCVTVALVDTPRKKVHYLAVERGGETVFVRGGGRFEEWIQPGLVTVEVSQLCELQIFTSSQEVPKRRPGCGGEVGYWTLTDSSFDTRAQAETRVRQLQGLGISSVGSADTGDWPSVCPPYFIVYAGQYATQDAAVQRLAQFKDVLSGDSYPRFLSTDKGDRPVGCPG